VFGSDGQGRRRLDDTRIRKQNVDPALALLDGLEKPVEVSEVRHIALNGGHILADICDRFVQLRLASSGDKHIRAFLDEPFGRCQPDSAVSTGDYSDFPL